MNATSNNAVCALTNNIHYCRLGRKNMYEKFCALNPSPRSLSSCDKHEKTLRYHTEVSIPKLLNPGIVQETKLPFLISHRSKIHYTYFLSSRSYKCLHDVYLQKCYVHFIFLMHAGCAARLETFLKRFCTGL
jgi:hypothetical protein